jgi:hypothetical protein
MRKEERAGNEGGGYDPGQLLQSRASCRSLAGETVDGRCSRSREAAEGVDAITGWPGRQKCERGRRASVTTRFSCRPRRRTTRRGRRACRRRPARECRTACGRARTSVERASKDAPVSLASDERPHRMPQKKTHLEELPPSAERSDALGLKVRVGHDDHVAPLYRLEVRRVFLQRSEAVEGAVSGQISCGGSEL